MPSSLLHQLKEHLFDHIIVVRLREIEAALGIALTWGRP